MRQSLRNSLTTTVVRLAIFLSLVSATGVANAAIRDQVVFFHNDHLGSAVTAVNENAELCWRESYTPYGDKLVNDDVYVPPSANCGLLGEERGYTGHTTDFETGLTYMQQRYYDPTMGRFLSIDPLGTNVSDVRTINRYSYAVNNPYRYTDPTGEGIADWAGAVWGGVTSFFSGNGFETGSLEDALMAGYEEGGMEALKTFATDLEFLSNFTPAGVSRKAALKSASIAKNAVLKRIKNATCSFDGSTEVLTLDGYLPIENVLTNQLVWSKDEITGVANWKPIAAIIESQYPETVYVEVGESVISASQTIISSRVHPFFVQRDVQNVEDESGLLSTEGHRYSGDIEDGYWVDAANLKQGDKLLTQSDNWLTVTGVALERKPLEAYNLDVHGFDTFFVRAGGAENSAGVWVHNSKGCDPNKVYHYTDEVGAKAIEKTGVIKPDAKGRVYVTKDKVPASEANNALFMGRGGSKGTHRVEIDLKKDVKLDRGTQPNELIHGGAIRQPRQGSFSVKKNDF